MERRLFVKLSTFTALFLTLPFAESCNTDTIEMAEARPLLFSHLVNRKDICEIGLAYRKMPAAENSKQKLTKLLYGNKEAAMDKESIQKMLEEQIIADFKKGDILMISGWVISLTEARQCALYSILKS